ncbi:hypothetical protein GCM10010466_00080 [Planomonospora alba]|uniref:Uncharacterized protein n=1 Tax=Planomonospora alba TaxID=161354 RepID=A0ABP6MKQ1_9ACTN
MSPTKGSGKDPAVTGTGVGVAVVALGVEALLVKQFVAEPTVSPWLVLAMMVCPVVLVASVVGPWWIHARTHRKVAMALAPKIESEGAVVEVLKTLNAGEALRRGEESHRTVEVVWPRAGVAAGSGEGAGAGRAGGERGGAAGNPSEPERRSDPFSLVRESSRRGKRKSSARRVRRRR